MRILHLRASNFVGGPEKQILQQCVRLTERGHESAVSSFLEGRQENELLEAARAQGLGVYPLQQGGSLDPRAVGELQDSLERFRPAVLCTHGYKADVVGWWAGRQARVPVVMFLRGWTGEDRKVQFYEWIDRQVVRRADRVVCVSDEYRRQALQLGVRANRLLTVRNAINAPARVSAAATRDRFPPLPRNAKWIVSAGRLSPEKGHGHLVEAARRVLAQRRDVVFLICGDGPQRLALERASQDIRAHVRFLGFRRDLESLLQCSDLFVLPSLREGLPNVLLEAAVAGVAALATRVGGVPEIVQDGETGFLVPPGDGLALGGRILELLEDPGRLAQVGERARDRVVKRFSIEKQLRILEALYLGLECARESPALAVPWGKTLQ